MRKLWSRFAGAVLAGLFVTACATPSLYAARGPASTSGYSEQRLDEAHWRVDFVGDETASAEVVERYLLYRAAELTLASGYDWFEPSAHAAWSETEVIVEAPRLPLASRSPDWRPKWRRRGLWGWSGWGPYPPSQRRQDDEGIQRSWSFERYAAREDIAMGRGPTPTGAFTAAPVIELLAPAIVRSQE
jgi:hypothetical protein